MIAQQETGPSLLLHDRAVLRLDATLEGQRASDSLSTTTFGHKKNV